MLLVTISIFISVHIHFIRTIKIGLMLYNCDPKNVSFFVQSLGSKVMQVLYEFVKDIILEMSECHTVQRT